MKSSSNYWIRRKNQVTGPYSSSELKDLVSMSQISPKHEISKDQSHWIAAARVKGLGFCSSQSHKDPNSHKIKLERYWVRHHGDVHGPYSAGELRELVKNRELRHGCEISRDQQRWKKVEVIKEKLVSPGQPTTKNPVLQCPSGAKLHSVQEETERDNAGAAQLSTSVDWLQYYRQEKMLVTAPYSRKYLFVWGIILVAMGLLSGIMDFVLGDRPSWHMLLAETACTAKGFCCLLPNIKRYKETLAIIFTDSDGSNHSIRPILDIVLTPQSFKKFEISHKPKIKLALLDEQLIMLAMSGSMAHFKHAAIDFTVIYGSTSEPEQVCVRRQDKLFYPDIDAPDAFDEISTYELSEWPLGPPNDLIDKSYVPSALLQICYRPNGNEQKITT